MRELFALDAGVVHVNHGSFGAVPRVVGAAHDRLRRRAEANPMRFYRVERHDLTTTARARAAAFLGVGPDDVALVRNATEATATVLAGLSAQGRLGPGDAVVSGSSGYPSALLAAEAWCARTGARHVVASLPVTATGPEVVAAYAHALDEAVGSGGRPALVVVDQVVSPTGGVLPVAAVTALARTAGAVSFVDAAHVPGHLADGPTEAGADFWTGTLHKWAYAVPGTAVLWSTEAERAALVPLTTSALYGRPYPLPFDNTGSGDHGGWWSLPTALDFWAEIGGFEQVARASALLDEATAVLAGVAVPVVGAPASPSPCLRLLALPDGVAATPADASRLYERLSADGFEAQVLAHGDRGWLRLSAAPYNELADYERLATALTAVLDP